jgi:hypothetical protein
MTRCKRCGEDNPLALCQRCWKGFQRVFLRRNEIDAEGRYTPQLEEAA